MNKKIRFSEFLVRLMEQNGGWMKGEDYMVPTNYSIILTLLSRLSLKRVDLLGVIMTDADLEGADFEQADLSVCSFSQVNFSGANFHQAEIDGAKFVECNLSETKITKLQASLSFFDSASLKSAKFKLRSERKTHRTSRRPKKKRPPKLKDRVPSKIRLE
ncbi:MAG TPA: pentapeptide repeat-containing protein [Xanthobacteraceae bacterium]|nr:pentapeptide repeat-containing protein [Xanthobacteraceae bacterium]